MTLDCCRDTKLVRPSALEVVPRSEAPLAEVAAELDFVEVDCVLLVCCESSSGSTGPPGLPLLPCSRAANCCSSSKLGTPKAFLSTSSCPSARRRASRSRSKKACLRLDSSTRSCSEGRLEGQPIADRLRRGMAEQAARRGTTLCKQNWRRCSLASCLLLLWPVVYIWTGFRVQALKLARATNPTTSENSRGRQGERAEAGSRERSRSESV